MVVVDDGGGGWILESLVPSWCILSLMILVITKLWIEYLGYWGELLNWFFWKVYLISQNLDLPTKHKTTSNLILLFIKQGLMPYYLVLWVCVSLSSQSKHQPSDLIWSKQKTITSLILNSIFWSWPSSSQAVSRLSQPSSSSPASSKKKPQFHNPD